MTVQELIERLQQYDKSLRVMLEAEGNTVLLNSVSRDNNFVFLACE